MKQTLNIFAQPWATRCKILITTLGSKGSLIAFKQKDLEVLTNKHIIQQCCAFADADMWRELEVKIAQFTGITTERDFVEGGYTIIR